MNQSSLWLAQRQSVLVCSAGTLAEEVVTTICNVPFIPSAFILFLRKPTHAATSRVCVCVPRRPLRLSFRTFRTMKGFMERRKEGYQKVQFGLSVNPSLGFDTILNAAAADCGCKGETQPPTEVKVGVSPAPKGIVWHCLKIQPFFFSLTSCETPKIECVEYRWPWDSLFLSQPTFRFTMGSKLLHFKALFDMYLL